ncbi:S8 family serine peptidase [bacterium]|nr:S8 family serine peptidase [bacterium]
MDVAKKNWAFSGRELVGNLPTTGKGVGVVVLDQGFDTTHPDLKNRVAAEVGAGPEDIFNQDAVGHGTHVLGIVGGDGTSSQGKLRGVAPEARLIPMKMNLDQNASWQDLSNGFARSVYWAVQNKDEFNIRVINCSFLLPMVELTDPATGVANLVDPLSHAIQMATKAGITVVAGVGNFGDQMQIMTPAGNPEVISVGALDINGTPNDPGDDKVAEFSSRGRSISGEIKPDLVAPGVHIMSTNAPGCQLEQSNINQLKRAVLASKGPLSAVQALAQKQVANGRLSADVLHLPEAELRARLQESIEIQAFAGKGGEHPAYLAQNGSSMASPFVAGVVANMLEANPNLSPAQVKQILLDTAEPVLYSPPEAQGRGAIQAQKAVAEAMRLAQGA